MRRFFLSFTFLTLFTLPLLAQQFQGGVAAGIVGSQVAGDTYWGYHKAGIYAGFWIRLASGEHSSFQTELTYYQKGSRHNPDEKRQDFNFYLMRLGYIEMPFLYQYHLKNKMILEAGPSFSVLLHSYEALNYEEVSYGRFSLLNPSVMLGFSIPLTERLSSSFRMNSSLLSIRTDPVSGARHRIFDYGQYNDCMQLFLSYKF
jgi:hypothetical protein